MASGNSTEQLLVGKLTVLALRQNGFQVNDHTGFATESEARAALLAGNVDVGWFYTGDIWTREMGHDLPLSDADQLAHAVAVEDERRGIIWLNPSPYVLRLGLVMREADLGKNQLNLISDLAAYAARQRPLMLCAPEELIGKLTGVQGFIQAYGLDFSSERVQAWSIPEGYQALMRGNCDCALGYSADVVGNPAFRFLEDDKAFFPVSRFALAIRQKVDAAYPDMQQVLDKVSCWLTSTTINALVRQVEQEKQPPNTVAQQFIKLQK